ncbi:hypothetical protein PCASD_13855 [Puccinia coronata f. sp. avenae]|uniref:Uncharacterized protein n=1 Tax=Puccinia coronata f. sp. avenae TaxID=200324 RepID=A0A2N5T363_9BASI|nr:hypothetical protein PCASD_13855 [Puccinia coronata f. sp. avenae]
MLPAWIFCLFIQLGPIFKISALPTIRLREEFQPSSSQVLETGSGHGSTKRHKTILETGVENSQACKLSPTNTIYHGNMLQVPVYADALDQQARSYQQGDLLLSKGPSQGSISTVQPSMLTHEGLNNSLYGGSSYNLGNLASSSFQNHPGLLEPSFLKEFFSDVEDPGSWNKEHLDSFHELGRLIGMHSTANEGVNSNNPSNMALEETSGSSSHADPSFSLCPIISQTSGGPRAAYVPNEVQKYLHFPISLGPRISPTSGGLPAAYGPNEVQKDLQFPGFWDHSNGQKFLEPLRVSSNEAGVLRTTGNTVAQGIPL